MNLALRRLGAWRRANGRKKAVNAIEANAIEGLFDAGNLLRRCL